MSKEKKKERKEIQAQKYANCRYIPVNLVFRNPEHNPVRITNEIKQEERPVDNPHFVTIKMIADSKGSSNGITVEQFIQGKLYTVSRNLAESFCDVLKVAEYLTNYR
jgi:hypothetical protein